MTRERFASPHSIRDHTGSRPKRAVSKTAPSIVLEVGQQSRVDVEMQVGDITQTVEVAARGVVNTESNLIGGVINQSRVINLPLNGRNAMDLSAMTAGIRGRDRLRRIVNKRAPTAAGMPHQENNYQLDGADNKEAFFNSWNLARRWMRSRSSAFRLASIRPSLVRAAVRSSISLPSPARTSFTARLGIFAEQRVRRPKLFLTPSQTIASLRRNQFGVAAGGPIIKNKMFLFGNYDGSRIRQGVFRTGVTPTVRRLAGTSAGTTKIDQGSAPAQPFPDNIIPTQRLDPISQALAKYYAAPNNPNPAQNFTANFSSINDYDSGLFRFDWRLSSKNDLMVRYGIQDIYQYTPGTFPRVGGLIVPQKPQNLALIDLSHREHAAVK